jgi:hypothetical protein
MWISPNYHERGFPRHFYGVVTHNLYIYHSIIYNVQVQTMHLVFDISYVLARSCMFDLVSSHEVINDPNHLKLWWRELIWRGQRSHSWTTVRSEVLSTRRHPSPFHKLRSITYHTADLNSLPSK